MCVTVINLTNVFFFIGLDRSRLTKKVKADIALHGNPISELRDVHLPYGITQCYLPPDTSERALPNPSHTGWYSIYLPRRDGRLSWRSWLDSAPAGSWTSDLSITSPTPNCCTTKTTTDKEYLDCWDCWSWMPPATKCVCPSVCDRYRQSTECCWSSSSRRLSDYWLQSCIIRYLKWSEP